MELYPAAAEASHVPVQHAEPRPVNRYHNPHPAAAEVELVRVRIESTDRDWFHVLIRDVNDRDRAWWVPATARELQAFPTFQAVAAKRQSVWVAHQSQQAVGRVAAQLRADGWQAAVARAFDAVSEGIDG